MLISSHGRRVQARPARGRLAARAFLLAGFTLLVLLAGAQMQKEAFFGSVVRPLLTGGARLPLRWVRSLGAEVQQLSIDVALLDLRALEHQAQRALEAGVLLADNEDFVPATLRLGGENVRVRLRLKGDTIRPLTDGKWSFRVKTSSGQAFLGMTQFSLHHPRERNWAYEWLFQRALRREGLIGLRYLFLDVSLNGRSLGVYALEEHFDRRLIAENERREGPIVRFSEDLMWREIAQQLRRFPAAQTNGVGSYEIAVVDGFHTRRELEDPLLRAEHLEAVRLLEALRRGEISASRAFDVERLGKYLALVDLFGAAHGTVWHNLRFYWNPLTARLEPIGFDANAGEPIRSVSALTPDAQGGPAERFFEDSEVLRAYVRNLDRVSGDGWLEGLLADLGDELDAAQAVLWTDYPSYEFSPEALFSNREYIRTVLRPVQALGAWPRETAPDRLELDVCNLHGLPVEIVALRWPDGAEAGPPGRTVIGGRRRGAPASIQAVEFLPARGAVAGGVAGATLVCRIEGTAGELEGPIGAAPAEGAAAPANILLGRCDIEGLEFIAVDDATRTITIRPGKWIVERDVVFPAGHTVRCGPGADLQVREPAVIVSHSPLEFLGAEEEPIRIRGGGGIAVLQAGGTSRLRHVWFESVSAPRRGAWSPTGAVTFYESPVVIEHCRFLDARAEDALNTVRGAISLRETVFARSLGDALDVDFCDGTISSCEFVQCGNDGIDLSGGTVALERVRVDGAGDKALSCGEAADVSGARLRLHGARVGIAAKDLSVVDLRDVEVSGCSFGLAAYRKKPEYGPGTLSVERVRLEETGCPWILERNSSLSIDGRWQRPDTEDAVARIEAGSLADAR